MTSIQFFLKSTSATATIHHIQLWIHVTKLTLYSLRSLFIFIILRSMIDNFSFFDVDDESHFIYFYTDYNQYRIGSARASAYPKPNKTIDTQPKEATWTQQNILHLRGRRVHDGRRVVVCTKSAKSLTIQSRILKM